MTLTLLCNLYDEFINIVESIFSSSFNGFLFGSIQVF